MGKTGKVEDGRAGTPEGTLQGIYDRLWDIREVGKWARAQDRFQPRTPGALFDLVAGIGLDSASLILDVGCGQGVHACELAMRFGSRVVAIDPVPSNVEAARARARELDLDNRVAVQSGAVEDLQFPDNAFDLVWCRSVAVHLADLHRPFGECARVLAPGGSFMLQTGYATDLLSEEEAVALRRRLGFVEASMQRPQVEAALAGAGFDVVASESYGSEFAEFYEEEYGRCASDLAGIARLQRLEDTVVGQFGRHAYETALGLFHWQVFQMLGKISYHAYLLSKS